MFKILLHDCCAPCGAFVVEELIKKNFEVTVFYFNPNIYPLDEYEKRKIEMQKYCLEKGVNFIDGDYEHAEWLEKTIEFKDELEGGQRCEICFLNRLQISAQKAKQNNFDFFGTTLTVSPYKNSEIINQLGKQIAEKEKIKFYDFDWKQDNGSRLANQLAKDYAFYRQNYCGCEFSLRK
ncbi:MAG TPA: epoxyqueuosine reductase QueH [bacterium]|nr:epoxyqueuosine reductase QueH [bacterium]